MVRRGFSALMALTLSFDATPKVFAKKHPRFFVREIHKGSSWKFLKLKLLRQAQRLPMLSCPSRPSCHQSFVARRFWLRHYKQKMSNTSGATQVALFCIFTMLFTSKTRFNMFWCAMSKRLFTRPMAMRVQPVRWGLHWSLLVLVLPMRLPVLRRPIWIAFPWSSLRVKCLHMPLG